MSIDWSKAPEDATHYLPEGEQFFACWIKPGFSMREGRDRKWIEDDDSAVHLLIARPAQWSGEGLPPVGTVCEHVGDKIESVEVIAHRPFKGHEHDDLLVVFVTDSDVSFSSPSCFRPIRTAEQIAAENRIAEINEMLRHIRDWPSGSHGVNHCSQLKIHEDACCDLYDAGYRKQEAAQ